MDDMTSRVRAIGVVGIMFVLLVSGILVPVTASAQETASGIAGVVRDTTGAVLPGVTVEAASPALIEKSRSVATDGSGQYKIVDLRPGVYTVTFSLTGFGTVKREEFELPPNFTASVNAELQVGNVAETVVVSGQTPMVDVQNLTLQNRLSEEVLSNIPTGKTLYDLVTLMPAIVSAPVLKDVGGSVGEYDSQGSLHGSKQGDEKLTQNGMRFQMTLGSGSAFNFYIDPAGAQEIIVEGPAGGSAEYETGGVQVNVIPKDGGNTFSGSFLGNYAGSGLQSVNLTPALKAKGLTAANKTNQVHDIDFSVGGPISRNRLWFFGAARYWGNSVVPLNFFPNLAPANSFLYIPDYAHPTSTNEDLRANAVHLTWQASPKNKLVLSVDHQLHCDCRNNETTNLSPEAVTDVQRAPDNLYQIAWTHPATTKFLFEAGVTDYQMAYRKRLPPGVTADAISITDQSAGFTFNAPSNRFRAVPDQWNGRAAMSYVTGSHHFKTGLFWVVGKRIQTTWVSDSALTYTFSNGAPISLTEYASPVTVHEDIKPELGLYAQDQWTIRRVTVNMGLRFDYFHGYVPAATAPATLLLDARNFPAVDCVPCWKDINPRAGVAYDLFGDGRTAVKAGLGRYVAAENTSTANRYEPINASVNNVSRPWHPPVGSNYLVPNCNLRDPNANGDCERMNNTNFGLLNVTTTADPDTLNGWNKRSYNWQASASIQHTLRKGLAVSGGYYRTWYGNFTVTDNLLVKPADYSPYGVTAPSDPRLPNSGGYRITGLYNLNPTRPDGTPLVGQVLNRVRFASHYGHPTEHYNGFDFDVNARVAGGLLTGGVNIGNANNSVLNTGTTTTSATNNCFVVNSPQQLYQCHVHIPFQTQVKLAASYPLPGEVQASVSFQSLPGPPLAATWNAPNALVQPSLGRPLTGGSTATIQLITPFSQFLPRINQVDLRLAKKFHVGRIRMQGMFDVYNLTNASPVLAYNTTFATAGTNNWLNPLQILNGRLGKVGIQMNF